LISRLILSHAQFEIRTVFDHHNKDTKRIVDALQKETDALGKLP
jgi:ribosomal protein L16 Arg81 hydroxylase